MPISLKPHNVETYQKVTEKFKESNKVAVLHPTGTGKMFLALKLLEENKGKKAIYVAPSNPILHDVKKNIYAEGMTMLDFPKLKRITYQKLIRLTDEQIQELDADVIILDEFHHCGAPEWGKGVERLLNRNEGAKVLGLSATPLRYFDGLRDMSDELFENNIASEMTLEEAIEKEILPEASYVSTLYGYEEEIEDMQNNIDKIKDKDKKEEALDLLNRLREKLDENTRNLPEIFSEHMQNKSGKYIVFCKNIDDMNKKMKQASKMFGGVNSNITIRAISSKIRESDKILTEFEQDRDEGTLKLLYAVDMVNEGYHIKDLDGVVMMRPTFSPTIFTQQLGRALTVGGDKKTVVLDLVNNFDTCKIVEDFAEKMRQYKANDIKDKTDGNKTIRISIFDRTKEFREIAEKITELSKRRIVTLEQKIEIFERFAETGEELVGNTVFEDYPIGQWAIQIRSDLNKVDGGKDERNGINITEEQLERLENLGILERKIDSTLDEKIDSLVEWRKKHPKITITPHLLEDELKRYAKTDDEYKKIQEEYYKMQKYYEYVRVRKSQGKLNEEQILKCKEGNIGGVFGYPTIIEKLAKKYNTDEKDIDYLLIKYDTLDNFYEMHRESKIKGLYDIELERKIIKEVVDVDNNLDRSYDKLWKQLYYDDINKKIFYSSEELQKTVNKLNEREKFVIERRYKLVDSALPNDLESIGKELGVTRERIRQIEAKALRKLRSESSTNGCIRLEFSYSDEYITEELREEIEEIIKDIQLQNGDLAIKLEILKSIEEEIERNIENKKIDEIKQSIIEGKIENLVKYTKEDLLKLGIEPEEIAKISSKIEELKRTELHLADTKIDEVDFSSKTLSCLKRMGINTIKDLIDKTPDELLKNKYLGIKGLHEIIGFLDENGLRFKMFDGLELKNETLNEQEEKNPLSISIEKLNFSARIYNQLKRDGINTIEELINKTPEEILHIRHLGRKCLKEIVDKLKERGLSLKMEDEAEIKNETSYEIDEQVVENEEKTTQKNAEKKELVQKLMEQQKIIDEQQDEIKRLRKMLETPQQ